MELVNPDREATAEDSISADEALLIIAYRNCNPRRKAAIRNFASKLGTLNTTQSSQNVVPFKPRQF